jgi:hypothetical protein
MSSILAPPVTIVVIVGRRQMPTPSSEPWYGRIGFIFFKGTKMRATALVILLCISSQVVSAQTTEQCQPTQRAGDLLACYSRTAPPHTLGKPKTSKASTAPNKPAISEAPIAVDKPAVSKNPTDRRERYVDVLAAENSKLDAKMKTICRGC